MYFYAGGNQSSERFSGFPWFAQMVKHSSGVQTVSSYFSFLGKTDTVKSDKITTLDAIRAQFKLLDIIIHLCS